MRRKLASTRTSIYTPLTLSLWLHTDSLDYGDRRNFGNFSIFDAVESRTAGAGKIDKEDAELRDLMRQYARVAKTYNDLKAQGII